MVYLFYGTLATFSLHKVDSLGQACANATTSSNIKEYYILLEKTLNDNNH